MDSIDSIKLNNVEVQANGIIRNSKGRLIGRLVDGVEYEGEHIKGLVENTNDISDGYHTFGELYEHRFALWIKLCDRLSGQKYVWCSTKHFDGSSFGGWFILGMGDEKGKQD